MKTTLFKGLSAVNKINPLDAGFTIKYIVSYGTNISFYLFRSTTKCLGKIPLTFPLTFPSARRQKFHLFSGDFPPSKL